MVEPDVSLLEWGFTDKQVEQARMIHVVMDKVGDISMISGLA